MGYQLVGYLLTLAKFGQAGKLDDTDVDEGIRPTSVRPYESIPFFGIEPLYRSFDHCSSRPQMRWENQLTRVGFNLKRQ